MAKWRILGPVFLAPSLFKEGDIVLWAGVPNGLMEPLDEEAREAWTAYEAKHPLFAQEPIPQLPDAQLVQAAGADSSPQLSLAEAMNSRVASTDQRPGPAIKTPRAPPPPPPKPDEPPTAA